MAHGTPKHHPKSRKIHITPVKSEAGKKMKYEGPGPKYGAIPRVPKPGPYPPEISSKNRPYTMDVPDRGREIIRRPVTTLAEVLKPPRGAGTKKAVIAAGKTAVKGSTYPAKATSGAAKTAGGMAKKAAGWIKRQGFVPTIR